MSGIRISWLMARSVRSLAREQILHQTSDAQDQQQWADGAVGAVLAGSIVVHFDVLEYGLPHLLSGGESLAVNGLNLERVEEALGTGIIVTIALRTLAAEQLVLPDQLLIGT